MRATLAQAESEAMSSDHGFVGYGQAVGWLRGSHTLARHRQRGRHRLGIGIGIGGHRQRAVALRRGKAISLPFRREVCCAARFHREARAALRDPPQRHLMIE